MNQAFKVSVGEFTGPLSLLLELVEKRRMSINQISLAKVADDFLGFVEEFKQDNLPMNILGEFLVVASTLMLIKSVSLLPQLELTKPEREEADALEHRLALYKIIKAASALLSKKMGKGQTLMSHSRAKDTVVFSPSSEITPQNLSQVMSGLINNWPESIVSLPQVKIKKIISLERAIEDLAKRVQYALKLNFGEVVKGKKERISIIVNFLALLELCKRGLVEVDQVGNFDEIKISSRQPEVPHY